MIHIRMTTTLYYIYEDIISFLCLIRNFIIKNLIRKSRRGTWKNYNIEQLNLGVGHPFYSLYTIRGI